MRIGVVNEFDFVGDDVFEGDEVEHGRRGVVGLLGGANASASVVWDVTEEA